MAGKLLTKSSPFATAPEFKRSPLSYVDPALVLERARAICRRFGSGSPQYEEFLREVNSDPMCQVENLPGFVPGDVRDTRPAKGNKTKYNARKKERIPAIETITEEKPDVTITKSNGQKAAVEVTALVYETKDESKISESLKTPKAVASSVDVESPTINYITYDTKQDPVLNQIRQEALYQRACNIDNLITVQKASSKQHINHVLQKTTQNSMEEYKRLCDVAREYKQVVDEKRRLEASLTEAQRKNATLRSSVQELRRTHSELHSEQLAMDEQVANQLQILIKEKAVLIEENCRLKNENEGLKALLAYATAEAASDYNDDDEDERHEDMVPSMAGISAWHPPSEESDTPVSSSAISSEQHQRASIDSEYSDSLN